MLEVLSLVAIGLALYTLNASRNSAQKLGEEVMRLKREVETLKAGGVVLQAEAAPEEAGEAETAVEEPVAGETAPEDFSSPWAAKVDDAEKGRSIFGGAAAAAPAEAVAASEPAEQAVATPAKPKESFESRIGARWAVWVGGIALALGGIFMVK